jgi:undecaprenyl-diphosphatase
MLDYLKNIDSQLLLFINGHHNSFWDAFMWQASGKYFWFPFILVIGYIIYKYRKQSWIIFLSVAVLVVLTDQISSHLIKNLVERLRPTHEPSLQGLIHIINNYQGGLYGFVSSHAANSFGLTIFFSLLFRNKFFTMGIFAWTAIISYSRMYLGVHYPGDILGGMLVGFLCGYMVFIIMNKILKTVKKDSV